MRLTNNGSDATTVEIPVFKSSLGNFVVSPESLTLSPGESAEVLPMRSTLGLTSTELPLEVTLKLDGKTESQTLDLRVTPADQPGSN